MTGPIEWCCTPRRRRADTDFTAKLVDVHPNGTPCNSAEGIIRARYRESFERAELLEPGEVAEYPIDCWPTSNVFRAGHRLRVEISSSNFPRFDRNLNTGEGVATGTRLADRPPDDLAFQRVPIAYSAADHTRIACGSMAFYIGSMAILYWLWTPVSASGGLGRAAPEKIFVPLHKSELLYSVLRS